MKGFTREEFDKYVEEMWKRLEMGEKLYGSEYKTGDIKQSILEEGTDLANYSFLLYLKVQEYNDKIKSLDQ